MRYRTIIAVSALGWMNGACQSEVEEADLSRGPGSFRRAEQHLSAQQNQILGFESPVADWIPSNGSLVTASSEHSEGLSSLSVLPQGYTELVSAAMNAPGQSRSVASLDLKLSQAVSWGDLRLVVQIPSQGQAWRDLGAAALSGRAAGVFHKLSFTIPSDLRIALDSNATDLRFRIILNVPSASGAYLLDNLVVSESGGAAPPPPTLVSRTFTIKLPEGRAAHEMMIAVSDRLTVDDGSVLGTAGALTQVAALGTSVMELGANVQAYADISSIGSVSFLRSQSHVHGRLTSAGTVTRQTPTFIDGLVLINTPIPTEELKWEVSWPTGATNDVVQPPDALNIALLPGSYDAVQIFSRATATLSTGTYYINSLVTEPQAHLRLDASRGPIYLYVSDTLRVGATPELAGGTDGSLVLGYWGSQIALMQAAVSATILAPNATLELRRPSDNLAYKGSFFAKRLRVFSNAMVRHTPFFTVAPQASCVRTVNGQNEAVFGYQNLGTRGTYVGIGAANQFLQGGVNQGQPTTLLPGSFDSAFAVRFASPSLTWSLNGMSATVTAQSPACPPAACTVSCGSAGTCVGNVCLSSCGDGLCGGREDCTNCTADCSCDGGRLCVAGACGMPAQCGSEWECGSGLSLGQQVDCGACADGKTCSGHVCN